MRTPKNKTLQCARATLVFLPRDARSIDIVSRPFVRLSVRNVDVP